MQKTAEMQAPQREQLFLETCYGFTNDPCSANCTAAQMRLRNGYCLKHAQIAGGMDFCIKNSSECLYDDAEVFETQFHAFAVAHAPIVRTSMSPPLAEHNTNFRKADHAKKLPKF